MKLPDVDIDLADRYQVLELIDHIKASQLIDGRKRPHNSGVYLQSLPCDLYKVSGLDFKQAEARGYFKFDLLNNSAYKSFTTKTELEELAVKEPNWAMLQVPDIVEQLPHVHDHLHILETLKPQSIEQLAAVLAIIRPGKRYLLNRSWDEINSEVWTKTQDQYSFKKSHAIAYAVLIVAVLNKLIS